MKRLVVVLFALVVLFAILHFAVGSSFRAGFEERVAALRDAGEPTELREMLRPPVPAEENAALVLLQAGMEYDRFVREHPEPDLLFLEEAEEDQLRDATRAYVDAGAEFGRLLERAVALPECRFDVDTSNPFTMTLQGIVIGQHSARYLQERALLEARDGQPERAARTLVLLLAVADRLDGFTLIEYFVRNTLRSVATEALRTIAAEPGFDAAAARALLEPRLAACDGDAGLLRALRGERCFGLWGIRHLLDGGDLNEFFGEDRLPGGKATTSLLRPLIYRDGSELLDRYAQALELCARPYWESAGPLRVLAEETAALDGTYFVTRLMIGLPSRARREGANLDARLGVARLGLAALAFREERGAWPGRLADLAPLFDGPLPLDPFTGEPFQLRRDGEGLVLEAAVPITPEQEERRDELEVVWRLR